MSALFEPRCVWPLQAELGEGPVWSAAENALWFVDIKQQRLHRFDPAGGEGRSWAAPAPPGFLAPCEAGGFIVGLKTGLCRFDPATGAFSEPSPVEPGLPGNRLNDGAVDPAGRLWFGSMDDGEEQATGALYRLDAGGLSLAEPGYVITNGPAVSPDGRRLYHTDTLEQVIYAFDLSPGGELSGKRVFARIEPRGGYPDGPTVDAAGKVWTGLFGGWGVRCYSPHGELLRSVCFPCANITKIAFGGEDLLTAYATTAWKGLDGAGRAEQPLAGGLFTFRVDTPGQPQHRVRHEFTHPR
ncbi:SMP-30/gluconolactonase/LRE family protein [Phenylobacterium montanum]|uniref:SMP-30/gluconolactonase/LRE family protein n=1 Tax=Phenylobacterium montanum TaxID=2823693 RepID=A0A975FZZ8_9CAUL|nr:SMP-30/gluconolactonase/LRE family protein [Caulobacter sp. S6]QUD88264.1 SMP-30/gluconolactonase/LRE family protein [Caulobacter sp. S6]